MEIYTLTPEQVFEGIARAKAEQRHQFYCYRRLAKCEAWLVTVHSSPILIEGTRFALFDRS
ncbi:MAG: hypothetical protein M0036_11625 [Desulfobacteraceae bacterium]|nr:hypothetical protein [Desulfobacteraceae bacterium]